MNRRFSMSIPAKLHSARVVYNCVECNRLSLAQIPNLGDNIRYIAQILSLSFIFYWLLKISRSISYYVYMVWCYNSITIPLCEKNILLDKAWLYILCTMKMYHARCMSRHYTCPRVCWTDLQWNSRLDEIPHNRQHCNSWLQQLPTLLILIVHREGCGIYLSKL